MSGSIMGQVVFTGTGTPVAAAEVTLSRQEPSSKQLIFSRNDGWFRADNLAAGFWVVSTRNTESVTVEVFDQATTDVALEVPNYDCSTSGGNSTRGSVRGRVISASDGAPVADATVTVINSSGSLPDIAPLSNARGEFALDGLTAGLWIFRAVSPDGAVGEGVVAVRANRTSDLVIEIQRQHAKDCGLSDDYAGS